MSILRDGDTRCENPADTGARDLFGRDPLGTFDQFWVVCRAHANVMGKNHRTINIIVAMNGIYAVEKRNFQPRLERLILKSYDEMQPVLG